MAIGTQFGASPSGGGLTFGTPTSTPAFGTSFGVATPSFGATAAPAFGATTAPAFGATTAPAFGATTAPAFGATTAPAFGATSTPAFGATSAPAFGATSAPAFGTGGSSLFTASAAPTFSTNAAPSFGVTPTPPFGTATTSSFGFGTPGSLNFGAATSMPSTGLTFPTTSATALNFGAPAASAAPSLGGFNFSGSGPATTSAASGDRGFFGGGLTAPPASNTAFGLGSNATSLFAKPITTQAITSTTAIASIGLGGVDSSSGNLIGSTSGANITGGTGSNQSAPAPKSTPLPALLASTVDAFKENVRQQKQLSSDIARCSIRPLHKVQNEADSLIRDSTELSAALAARRRTANGLRTRAANALPAAERAHRIAETPHGLEYESGDVVTWITEVVAEGETRLRLLRKQLEAAQRQLDTSPRAVTDEELALGMRRIHESFIAVAGRLQAVHQQVEAQKAQYIALRRNIFKDPTDVFAKQKGTTKSNENMGVDWLSKSLGKANSSYASTSAVVADPLTALGMSQSSRQHSSTTGPNPFSNLGPPGFSGLPFAYAKSQTANTPGQTALGNSSWGMTSLQPGGAFSGIGAQSPFSTSFSGLPGTDQSPFALQKPPAGNKRGKC